MPDLTLFAIGDTMQELQGTADLCHRADNANSAENVQSSNLSSPGPFRGLSVPRTGNSAGAPINERILTLVNTLSDRVQNLEASIQRLEPRKRQASEDLEVQAAEGQGFRESESSSQLTVSRPTKYARTLPIKDVKTAVRREEEGIENESSSGQNASDAEVEDAATVLEFLAWGRLKDSSITNDLRDMTGNEDSTPFQDKAPSHNAQNWGHSPSVVSGGGYFPLKASNLSQIQELLPSKTQVILLCEYHANWLLFMHCSFHVTTFSGELDQFYSHDEGIISVTSTGMQWAALLFSIMCGSMTCARPSTVASWGFNEREQSHIAQQWYQAAIECLDAAKYQQNHCIYSVQAISSMTICAHILGYSNSQSVLLAAAVRIGQSLGLHRLTRHSKDTQQLDGKGLAEAIQKETRRRLWQQLAIQDWFSVPFSETYCVNRLHFSTKPPLHCDDETLQPLAASTPSITSYGNFLFRIACLMPELLDKTAGSQTVNMKYEQVLHFDQRMRDLVTTQLPPCINGQMPTDSSWPTWVPLARRCLTVTAAHKIIMIHRKFLGMSFHDARFVFTRRTCLAAAKTIINEVKQEAILGSPTLWTFQAFMVAAAIILSLDNFNRSQSSREYTENRQLVSDTIVILAESASVSAIAARGTRLLTELLVEEENFHAKNILHGQSQEGKQQDSHRLGNSSSASDKTLNVSAFVKKFCEANHPPSESSPIAAYHVPLWLQDSGSHHQNGIRRSSEDLYDAGLDNRAYSASSFKPHSATCNNSSTRSSIPVSGTRQFGGTTNPFGQNFSETFDIRSVNWFDDLLGLAPSNSL
ncbi:hypothetical protein BP6252_11727 [Coleophoma cylindrospora]|uniref:Uncharacterized protein n=1 Tax=Coleophoma cylindrospora TaxID=1849047 RepID=A0A3D8QLF9_9HELO|nr:hypothetical protein BP6252_11727 [Coleophoma cylindrospora]